MPTSNRLIASEIRQAFVEGNIKKATELTQRISTDWQVMMPTVPLLPFFGNYTTLGEIYIETGLSEIGMSNYKRILSLDSALAIVNFHKDGVEYTRTSFVSYPDSVMVLKFTADKPGMQNLVFSYGANPEAIGEITPDGERAYFMQGS